MELWRISNYADLTGTGGLRASGRWHSRGRRIVYLADHPSSAVLEMLVHMDREFLPATYQLLRIAVPNDLEANVIAPNDLPLDWANRLEVSRQVGDNWLDHGTSPLLRVPSAIVPQADNFLLNPAHPDAAQIAIAEVIRAPFDPRLIGG